MRIKETIRRSHYLLMRALGRKIDSNSYWEWRYQTGGNSGDGSAGQLAQYKADFLNTFIAETGSKSILELGCGDGRQLTLAQYPSYLGVDVSETAIRLCQSLFANDRSKEFKLVGPGELKIDETFDLVLSLDVMYHITDPSQFRAHILNLFNSTQRYVIIYSSVSGRNRSPHVLHRDFRQHIATFEESGQIPHFKLKSSPTNPFSKTVSFFVYEKFESS